MADKGRPVAPSFSQMTEDLEMMSSDDKLFKLFPIDATIDTEGETLFLCRIVVEFDDLQRKQIQPCNRRTF
jgi:hypothetical protein